VFYFSPKRRKRDAIFDTPSTCTMQNLPQILELPFSQSFDVAMVPY
jgi:hypothetical protein